MADDAWRARTSLVALCGISAVAAALSHLPLSVDLVAFARAAETGLRGRLPEVYASDWLQAGPWELLASLVALPLPGQHDDAYLGRATALGLAPLHLIGGALAVLSLVIVIRLVARVTGTTLSRWAPLLATAVGLAFRLPVQFFDGGHLAQVAIPITWALGAGLALSGRRGVAAVLLGLGCGWEPWGALGAPLLLLGPAGRRAVDRLPWAAGLFAICGALPYLPFVLTGSFAMFRHEWFVIRDTLPGLLLPHGERFSWPLRLLQGGAAMAAGAAVIRALPRRVDAVWLAPLAIHLVRLILDPLNFAYYWYGLLLLPLIGLALLPLSASRLRLWLTAALVAVPQLPNLLPGQEAPGLLASCTLVATLGLLAAAVVVLRRETP